MKQNKNVNGCRADNIHIVISCFLLVTHTSLFHGKNEYSITKRTTKIDLCIKQQQTKYLQKLKGKSVLELQLSMIKI